MASTIGARIILCCSLLLASEGWAAPAHVIRFAAAGAPAGCTTLGWADVLTFYNSTSATATVRVLGISNGTPFRTSPDRIDVPPGTVVWAESVLNGAWAPASEQAGNIWIMNLDVPPGVVVESRDEIFLGDGCIVTTPVPNTSLGKVSLPVFHDAVPANEQQVHLGTDVGSKAARLNVGIYNQSQIAANAHIEVRRSCDNSVVDARDVQVPPDTLIQVTGFHLGANTCAAFGTTFNWLRYTVVTVDQPSFTFATVLSERLNAIPGLAPEVGLAVPFNARY